MRDYSKKDFAGNVYIAGSFEGINVDFDPGAGTALKSTNGLQDLYIVKYTATGAFSWAITMGGTNTDVVKWHGCRFSGKCIYSWSFCKYDT
ncbi:MAG: hypothetical protein IPK03_01735 [Bacteroidetes bacterium]|nr:hypothetical protein [Bacteroidota bacterium]